VRKLIDQGAGSSSAAFSSGGAGYEVRTEEWNAPDLVINTLTTS
jgi:hypothetical protein